MGQKVYSEEDLISIAREVIDLLRPKHLTIRDVRNVLQCANKLLDFMVIREKD